MGYYTMNSGGVFERFFKRRSDIIKSFESGEISKRQFLEFNYELVRRTSIKPFLRIDNFEMGIYNYQYYNVLAKYFNMLAKEIKGTTRNQRQYRDYTVMGNNYYTEKDKAIFDILEFLDYEGVEAYYINMESRSLNGTLYEIVLLDYEEAIFHSKAQWLLDKLKEKGVFDNEKKNSLIDEYINNTY